MKQGTILTILIISCFINSCKKINYYPDKNYKEVTTAILAHRAGWNENSEYQENSLEAATNCLTFTEGIEVDVQISKDGTVWLQHDAELPDCGGISYNCFPDATDNQIIELDSCNGNTFNYTKLEDIFILISSSYPDKHISIDVKAWTSCAGLEISILGKMNEIGDEIIALTEEYNLHNLVMVESETATFLNHVKDNSNGIECYLTTFGDFERGMQLTLEYGYAGISFKYKYKEEISIEHIQLIRSKGLKIQLWTVNSEEDIKEALSINPDYIQTDNLEYFE